MFFTFFGLQTVQGSTMDQYVKSTIENLAHLFDETPFTYILSQIHTINQIIEELLQLIQESSTSQVPFENLPSVLQKTLTLIKSIQSLLSPDLQSQINPITSSIEFLQIHIDDLVAEKLSGRDLMNKLADSSLLSNESKENLVDVLEEEDSKTIQDCVFGEASLLLLIFRMLPYLPDALITSPEETLNFKFGLVTIICNESRELQFINQCPLEHERIYLSNLISDTQLLLSWISRSQQEMTKPFQDSFAKLIIPVLLQIAFVFKRNQSPLKNPV